MNRSTSFVKHHSKGSLWVTRMVMDKTLTPSHWTTLMDYPNGLPLKKILFQMSGMFRGCSTARTILFLSFCIHKTVA